MIRTAEESLLYLEQVVNKAIEKNPEEKAFLIDNYQIEWLKNLKVTENEILEIENKLSIKLPNDYKNFRLKVGNFKIGQQVVDDYGDGNNEKLLEFEYKGYFYYMTPFYDMYLKVFDELRDEVGISTGLNEQHKKSLNNIIPFFFIKGGYGSFSCFDIKSQNSETLEMSIINFSQDYWFEIATREILECRHVNVFDSFISTFVDEQIEYLREEF